MGHRHCTDTCDVNTVNSILRRYWLSLDSPTHENWPRKCNPKESGTITRRSNKQEKKKKKKRPLKSRSPLANTNPSTKEPVLHKRTYRDSLTLFDWNESVAGRPQVRGSRGQQQHKTEKTQRGVQQQRKWENGASSARHSSRLSRHRVERASGSVGVVFERAPAANTVWTQGTATPQSALMAVLRFGLR